MFREPLMLEEVQLYPTVALRLARPSISKGGFTGSGPGKNARATLFPAPWFLFFGFAVDRASLGPDILLI